MKKQILSLLSLMTTTILIAQVSNPGFEDWTNNPTYAHPDVSPANFSSVNDQTFFYDGIAACTEVPGFSGSAMRLETRLVEDGLDTSGAYGIMGSLPTGEDLIFSDGFPFTDVTVSGMTVDLRYDINPVSPGFIIVQFLSNGVPVTGGPDDDGTYIFQFSGDQSTWDNFTFDFLPSLSQIPDECVIGFGSNDMIDSETAYPGDWLEVDNIEMVGMMTDVPGGDFDSWIDQPEITTLNEWQTYLPPFVDFITQSEDSHSGDFSLKLETLTFDEDTVQAMVYQAEFTETGIIPNQMLEPNSTTLEFFYKFESPSVDEEGVLYLLLSESDDPEEENTGFAIEALPQTSEWTQVTIDLNTVLLNANYYGLVFFSGAGFDASATGGSVLLLDDVQFLTEVVDCEFVPVINEGSVTICDGETLFLTTQDYDDYEWYVVNPGEDNELISTSSSIIFPTDGPGMVNIYLEATLDSCTVVSETVSITINPNPTPTISLDYTTLTTEPGNASYTWYYEGTEITGENSNSIDADENGIYLVVVISVNGCVNEVDFNYTTNSIEEFNNSIAIFPNPVNDFVNINFENDKEYEMEVYNLIGEMVYSTILETIHNKVDLSTLSNGSYLIKIKDDKKVISKNVVIHR